MTGDQHINLTPMVLVISQTLIHLRAGQVWKAPSNDRVHGFAILEQANDIVDSNPSTLNDGVAAAHAGLAADVAVGDGYC